MSDPAWIRWTDRIEAQSASWGRQLFVVLVLLAAALFFLMGLFFCVEGCMQATAAETVLQQQAGYLSLIVGLLSFVLVSLFWFMHPVKRAQGPVESPRTPPAPPPDPDAQAFRAWREKSG